MVVSEFNNQTGVLESKFTGKLSLKEVLDYIIATKNNREYPRDLKIITDSSQAIFDFSFSDLQSIVIENEKSLEQYDSITDAIIVSNPNTTALSMLYQELEKSKKYRFNIFATKKASLGWLNQF